MSEPLLRVEDVATTFTIPNASGLRPLSITAVDGVSFTLDPGQSLGIVGESGCGKSTLARTIVRLLEPARGRIVWNGTDIAHLSQRKLRPVRHDLQIVFQDPYLSLDPKMRVGKSVELAVAMRPTRANRGAAVRELFERVGLRAEDVSKFPHEFSGGQRQRIGIARALAIRPRVIVLDEPVSALDVSIQAQVLNLLKDLQKEYALGYVLISHNIAVVRHMCETAAGMYLGKFVESGSSEAVLQSPAHPYTRALLSAIPTVDPDTQRQRIILAGDLPSPLHVPTGCRFRTRCWKAAQLCETEPPLEDERGRAVACHFPEPAAKSDAEPTQTAVTSDFST